MFCFCSNVIMQTEQKTNLLRVGAKRKISTQVGCDMSFLFHATYYGLACSCLQHVIPLPCRSLRAGVYRNIILVTVVYNYVYVNLLNPTYMIIYNRTYIICNQIYNSNMKIYKKYHQIYKKIYKNNWFGTQFCMI